MSKKLDKDPIAIKRGERLRFIRRITGMVAEPFGKLCGIGRTTISSWEQGINKLTERGAEKVVRGIDREGIRCTPLWLLHGIGEPPKIVDQEKLSKLNYHTLTPQPTASLEEARLSYTDTEMAKEIELFTKTYAEHFIYRISDMTMYPSYIAGEWVGGVMLTPQTLDLAHDRDCIAQLKNGSILVRRVKVEGFGSFKLSLYGTNAETCIEHPPLRYLVASQITALAPIIRIWRHSFETEEK